MASRKRRPIVMRRDRKPPKFAFFFKKVVLIIAIVGAAYLFIVFFMSNKEAIKERFLSFSKETSKPTRKISSSELPSGDSKENKKERSRDSAIVIKPESAKLEMNNNLEISALVEANESYAEVMSVSKSIPSKQPIEKKGARRDTIQLLRQISLQEMEEVFNDIRLKKIKANNTTNCIHLQMANNSNVENMVEITNYLRNNGYVIAGREVIAGEHKGIQIDATGTCIYLVIGKI